VNQSVLDALPSNVRSFAEQLEAFSGTHIEVRISNSRVDRLRGEIDPDPGGPACQLTETEAVVWVRDFATVDPQGFLHELLHIERYWVAGVPQIVALAPDVDRTKITSGIENALEHLHVVPGEAMYGFDPYPYRNENSRRLWAAYPWPTITNRDARRRNCLLAWVTVDHLVTNLDVKLKARQVLDEEGFRDEAEALSRRLGQLKGDKERSLAAVVRFLDIPRPDVQLVYLDVQNRQRRLVPVPHR